MGRPVEELTREELIEVLTDMVALQQQERDTARKDKDFLFDCMDIAVGKKGKQ